MTHVTGRKLAIDHTAEDIQQLEDDMAAIVSDLREVRTKMKEAGIRAVTLKSGTFRLYLNQLQLFSKNFLRDTDKAMLVAKRKRAETVAQAVIADHGKAAEKRQAKRAGSKKSS